MEDQVSCHENEDQKSTLKNKHINIVILSITVKHVFHEQFVFIPRKDTLGLPAKLTVIQWALWLDITSIPTELLDRHWKLGVQGEYFPIKL